MKIVKFCIQGFLGMANPMRPRAKPRNDAKCVKLASACVIDAYTKNKIKRYWLKIHKIL